MSAWKPGDVISAHVRTRGRRHVLVFDPAGSSDHPWLIADCDLGDNGTSRVGEGEYSPMLIDARHLVLIDPESHEDTQRLAECYCAANSFVAIGVNVAADRLRNALREFATPTPPKPDEPLGLGAVVVDAEGQKWVRAGGPEGCWSRFVERDASWDDMPWSQLDAVEVLSEGIR